MRRFEIIDHHCCSPFLFFESSTSISKPCFPFPLFHDDELISTTLDLLHPHPSPCPPTFSLLDFPPYTFDQLFCDSFHTQTTPFCTYERVLRRRFCSPESYLHNRVTALESKLYRLVGVERKYSWTGEMKGAGALERKYKLKAEIEGNDFYRGKRGERKYKWKAEIKGLDNQKRTYTWEAAIDGDNKVKKELVEIDGADDCKAVALRKKKAIRKALTAKDEGKRKELSPQEAAAMIQMNYKAYVARRSQSVRDLRELAVARTKLRELRILFQNYSYRSRIAHDAEERQRFSEKIIVLLLTVDAIKGVDHMVKVAKRSMVHELEAMLEWVDPHLHSKRRTFDMPSGGIPKEIAEGVAKLVELVDQ